MSRRKRIPWLPPAIRWLLPASCSDPECDADHGYEGTLTSDDISLRISAEAEGATALAEAIAFSSALSAAIGPRSR